MTRPGKGQVWGKWRLAAGALLLCAASLLNAQPSTAPVANVAQALPVRIVSINACSDQLVLLLAQREHIMALSIVVSHPQTSALWRQAQGIKLIRNNAEEVMALQPDIVFAGNIANRHTVRILKEQGVRVFSMKGAESFDDVRQHIKDIAAVLGVPARGAALIAEFDASLQSVSQAPLRRAAYYRHGGSSAGSRTLIDDIFTGGRLENIAAQDGLKGYGLMPLERLVYLRPDWLITTDYRRTTPTVGAKALKHPALQGLPGGEYVLPGSLTACAGPWNAQASRHLSELALPTDIPTPVAAPIAASTVSTRPPVAPR